MAKGKPDGLSRQINPFFLNFEAMSNIFAR
jgi:hypothetical protein